MAFKGLRRLFEHPVARAEREATEARERAMARGERPGRMDEISGLTVNTGKLDGFDRIGVLRAQHPTKASAAQSSRLWRAAFAKYPELVLDLVRIGGLFQQGERYFEDGVERKLPLDPTRLAYDQGRREAVLDILGHNLSIEELNDLMEASNEY